MICLRLRENHLQMVLMYLIFNHKLLLVDVNDDNLNLGNSVTGILIVKISLHNLSLQKIIVTLLWG